MPRIIKSRYPAKTTRGKNTPNTANQTCHKNNESAHARTSLFFRGESVHSDNACLPSKVCNIHCLNRTVQGLHVNHLSPHGSYRFLPTLSKVQNWLVPNWAQDMSAPSGLQRMHQSQDTSGGLISRIGMAWNPGNPRPAVRNAFHAFPDS